MTQTESFKQKDGYRELLHLTSAACKEIETKLNILNSEFKIYSERNPIHHIESRIKSADSIVAKLIKKGFEVSPNSALENINDIAGIRVVCNYIDDVYDVAKMLIRQTDLKLIKQQDYIENPNYNGYRSLHLDVIVPIFLSDRTEYVKAEIQIRTIAMDFWASLEHDLKYKSNKKIPADISEDMLICSDEISAIDKRMQETFRKIQNL